MNASYGWGGTAAEVVAVVTELLRRGVVANVEINDVDEAASLGTGRRMLMWCPLS